MNIQPLKELEAMPYFIPTPAHRLAVVRNILADIKGYSSNQSEFRVVVAFKAAEPMALWVLVVGEHACRMAMWPLKSLSFGRTRTKPRLSYPSTLGMLLGCPRPHGCSQDPVAIHGRNLQAGAWEEHQGQCQAWSRLKPTISAWCWCNMFFRASSCGDCALSLCTLFLHCTPASVLP